MSQQIATAILLKRDALPSVVNTSGATIKLHQSNPDQSLRERAAFFLDRLVFFALLALIPITAMPYGTVHTQWEVVLECSVFALAILWITEGLLSGGWQLRGLGLVAPLVLLILFAFFQTLPIWNGGAVGAAGLGTEALRTASADPYETRRFAFRLLALVLAAELLLCYTSSRWRLRALVGVVIAVGSGSALFGIARQTMQGETMGFILPDLGPRLGYGQFINYNHFAFLMEMALGLLLGLLVGRGVPRNRILVYLALGAPMWTALVLSNSRGGILSMLCQVILLILLLGDMRRTRTERGSEEGIAKLWRLSRSLPARIVLVVFLVAMVGAGTVWVGGEALLRRIDTLPADATWKNKYDLDDVSRANLWRATWQLIKAHPIAGVGFGGYWVAIPGYYQASGEMRPEQAHNDYLELLASGGLIGAALSVWFVAACLRRSRKRLSATHTFSRAACYGALIGLFGVAVHSGVEFGLHVTSNALVFISLVVIATLDVREADQVNGERRAEFGAKNPSFGLEVIR